MPSFGHRDGFDTVSYITGPAHVMLGIRFSEAPTPSFVLLMRHDPRRCCGPAPLDASQIRDAVAAGVADAATEGDQTLHIAEAFYIGSDSPRYDLYRTCARLLASKHLTSSD